MARRKSKTQWDKREQLGLFVYRANELYETRLLQSQTRYSLSLKGDNVQRLQFASTTPDDKSLRSFLVVFRHFISKDEPVYLFKIYNVCLERLSSDEIKGYLVNARTRWQSELKAGGFALNYNGHEYSPEEILDLWINGYFFHNDHEKFSLLRNLQPLESALFRHKFVGHLLEGTRNVLYVAQTVKAALHEGWFSF